MKDLVSDYLSAHKQIIERVADEMTPKIISAAKIISIALFGGNKLLVFGNGGSAADSQHFAAELVGRFLVERRGLPAIALTTDTSILTAVGNDYGFDQIYSRQVQALACPGDVAFGISTSGNSENVFQALACAREVGCTTVGLLGRGGGRIAGMVDLALTVPSDDTPHIQEAHAAIIHLLCLLVENSG